jgi:hypothetical protein
MNPIFIIILQFVQFLLFRKFNLIFQDFATFSIAQSSNFKNPFLMDQHSDCFFSRPNGMRPRLRMSRRPILQALCPFGNTGRRRRDLPQAEGVEYSVADQYGRFPHAMII